MTIKGKMLRQIYSLILNLENKSFNIYTQYKLLKLKKILEDEIKIQNQQILCLKKFSKESTKEDFVIEKEYVEKAEGILKEIGDINITIPDIKFELEELESLELTLSQLELLSDFIIE